MTTYESTIQTILADSKVVFATLSDLRNLERLRDKIPAEAGISDMTCDADSVSFSVNPIGKISLRIVEREEPKIIKFASENSPFAFNLWIQLVSKTDTETHLKITLKADVPMMIKMMFGSKLQDFVNRFAEGLAKVEYK
jgi:carbon monoxide dehydrogenase subunit G